MKKWKLAYSVLFFGVCLTPLVGMGLTKEEASSENRTLSAFPALKTEEGLNVNWLSDAGDYFQDHFAFRNELVTANALVNGKIFQVSTASGVIQGTDGWLYYKDSLDDYLGINQLSDRGLFNVAHTLSMMQKNFTARGKKFLFTVAPNKNSLYGEHMPYYDSLKVAEVNNLARLTPILEKEGVNYTDLKSLFEAQDEVLYHERDSHWNNKGAALAADAIMTDLVKMHDSYKDEAYEVRTDHIGDLDKMLYPKALTPEDEVYYDKTTTFAYVACPSKERLERCSPSASGYYKPQIHSRDNHAARAAHRPACPHAPHGRCGADERGLAMVSVYPIWKADNYPGQSRRGQDLLCHAPCGGLHQSKAFARYGDT